MIHPSHQIVDDAFCKLCGRSGKIGKDDSDPFRGLDETCKHNTAWMDLIKERDRYYGQFTTLEPAMEVVRAARKLADKNLKDINELIDGYLDGAPDASPASKLANQINQIIHPQ